MLVASAICIAAAKENKPKPGQLQQKTDTPHRHIYSGGFANDFASSSVDLNQDGQPDNQQTYNMLPSSNPNYPYVYTSHDALLHISSRVINHLT